MNNIAKRNNNLIRKLTLGGLMIALVFVTTYTIKIPIPFTQGYIHGGDSMIFVAAILLGWKYGALAGGLGSAMADLLGGYAHWVLPTLIIKTIMGALVGWVAHGIRGENKTSTFTVTFIMAGLWLGCILFLRNLIGKYITIKSTNLLGEIDGVETMTELLALSTKLQSQLLWGGIIIAALVILLSLYLRRIDKNLFGSEQLLGMLVAGTWMVLGYYVASGIMYGSFIVPIFSIPWNIVQFVIGLVIAYFIIIALKKTALGE